MRQAASIAPSSKDFDVVMREPSSDNNSNTLNLNQGESRDMISTEVVADPVDKAITDMANEALR